MSVIVGEGFTTLPDGRKDALDLAFQAFPELKDEFDDPDDEFLSDVFYIYGLLSAEMVRRWMDPSLRERSCRFLNRLADSGDSLLEELLVVCLLETLAADAAVASQARKCLNVRAAGHLERVERETFGR